MLSPLLSQATGTFVWQVLSEYMLARAAEMGVDKVVAEFGTCVLTHSDQRSNTCFRKRMFQETHFLSS